MSRQVRIIARPVRRALAVDIPRLPDLAPGFLLLTGFVDGSRLKLEEGGLFLTRLEGPQYLSALTATDVATGATYLIHSGASSRVTLDSLKDFVNGR